MPISDDDVVRLLDRTVAAIRDALAADFKARAERRRERGERPGQYRLDLVADAAALGVLNGAGVGVLSEESGLDDTGSELVVVIDPVDGSTNASRGIPWYAASLCAVDDHGPRASVVVNLATGTRYAAVRNQGATCDGRPIAPSPVRNVSDAVLVLNGYPRRHLGWKQYRAMGATALDLCSVAVGMTDGTVDCSTDQLGPWDFLGAMLVLTEAGAQIGDVQGRPLVALDHAARRTPVSAATPELFEALLAARIDLTS